MTSTHEAELDIPLLPAHAKKVHIFPELASGSLLSIGQLCDGGCTATFTANKLFIYFAGKIIIQGTRQNNKLWTIDPPTTSPGHHSLNAAIDTPTIAERINFYHASLFSPTLDTLCKAIDAGYLTTFPSFTSNQVRKFPPRSTATAKGHLHAQRSNIRSTQKKHTSSHFLFNTTAPIVTAPTVIPDDDPITPLPVTTTAELPPTTHPTAPNAINEPHTNYAYPACMQITGKINTDQTGQFLVPSSSGNKYLFILYDYDSNMIHAEPIPNRTKHQLYKAYLKVTNLLRLRGLTPKLQRLDNEASQLMKDYMDAAGVDYQLTPAGTHRRNSAEKAVQTFKNHFISGLCSAHPNFPLNQWDRLIPQANITLNLLRPSRINPQLSAYAQVYGAFDYNKTPLAPPGIKILSHVLPDNQKSWAPHAEDGFYLGPALKHYRCHKVWITRTAAERIANTVKWYPHNNLKMPIPSRESIILAAIHDLTAAIQSQDTNPLLPPITTQTRQALTQLQAIFQPTTSPDSNTSPLPPTQVPRVPTLTSTPVPKVPHSARTLLPRVPTPSPSIPPPRRSNRIRTQRQPNVINVLLNSHTGILEEYRQLLKGPTKARSLEACST